MSAWRNRSPGPGVSGAHLKSDLLACKGRDVAVQRVVRGHVHRLAVSAHATCFKPTLPVTGAPLPPLLVKSTLTLAPT